MPTKVMNEILTAAIEGFEAQKTRINAQIAALRETLSGGPAKPAVAPQPQKRKRKRMSAASRARIAEAQRKRWAASKKALNRQPQLRQPNPNGSSRRPAGRLLSPLRRNGGR